RADPVSRRRILVGGATMAASLGWRTQSIATRRWSKIDPMSHDSRIPGRPVLFGAALLGASIVCASAQAQITVQGVTDKTVYVNTATFRVPSAAGYDYTATLNGAPV